MPGRITIKEEPLPDDPDRPRTWHTVLLICQDCQTINASVEMDHIPTVEQLDAYRCYKCHGPMTMELL